MYLSALESNQLLRACNYNFFHKYCSTLCRKDRASFTNTPISLPVFEIPKILLFFINDASDIADFEFAFNCSAILMLEAIVVNSTSNNLVNVDGRILLAESSGIEIFIDNISKEFSLKVI
jgi:hypothetical protein